MAELIATISSWIWGWPFVSFCLATGLFFSIRTRFLQIRCLKSIVALLFQRKSSGSGISSFQAFMLALSGRVGTGNIAGVAAWFNLIAILFLQKVAFKVLNNYESQLKTGVKKPSFLPEKWNKITVTF